MNCIELNDEEFEDYQQWKNLVKKKLTIFFKYKAINRMQIHKTGV